MSGDVGPVVGRAAGDEIPARLPVRREAVGGGVSGVSGGDSGGFTELRDRRESDWFLLEAAYVYVGTCLNLLLLKKNQNN